MIAECVIDTDLIAKFILKLIPVKGPYDLAMDRTNWKYSDTNINILTLGVIAGEDSIAHLMADREFVGNEWLGYLNACVRVVLPCWNLYSRKHQTDKGPEAWTKM